MPELPEVHTTVEGLKEKVVGLSICDVWTNYISGYEHYKKQIKNPTYFKKFKKKVIGSTIVATERRHKNILIHLSCGDSILIHMKMTGHLMYGSYVQTQEKAPLWEKEEWQPAHNESEHLWNPFNRHIRLAFSLSDGKQLVLSDMRKFAKVTLLSDEDLTDIGPEPLEKGFTFDVFKKRVMMKPKAPIKSVLMDHTVIAGIGNIYSDEILFESGIHPESVPCAIPEDVLCTLFGNIKPLLRRGIKFGGDSTSDYRDINGKPGKFQHNHSVYRETGKKCPKKDGGVIERKVIRGRSAHFCPAHQIKY
tara:strand:+ start:634 stop:1551 length:918 start_codon:yes stop_codon:yes gene_type:complete